MPPKRKSQRAEEIEEKKKREALRFGLKWAFEGETGKVPYIAPLLYLQNDELEGRSKVAGFDIDFTLIQTKSGRKFATGAKDWTWLYECVPARLRQLDAEGYRVVLFTNQAGIEKLKAKPEEIMTKIQDMINELNVPCLAFVCTGNNQFRKPSTAMWEFLESQCNAGVSIDMANSLYVGDAAGRADDWAPGKPKDFSCTDRMFAANIGIGFHTPEEFFVKEKPAAFEWKSFDARNYLTSTYVSNSTKTPSYHSATQEIVLMMGPPASGKSTFAKAFLVPRGYVWVNRDTLSTPAKCLKAATVAAKSGKSVVVDNTNPGKKDRQSYIELAKKNNVPCRCFIMKTPLDIAHHLNFVRQNMTNGEVRRIPDVAYAVFNKNNEEPSKAEGFHDVINIDFSMRFEDKRHKDLFLQWT